MKLLLDMGLSIVVAKILRQAGHDAVHAAELNLARATDLTLMRLAAAEKRIMVTFDLDFGHILALQRLVSPSVILFRIEHATTQEIGERLTRILTELHADLEDGAIVVVDEDRTRVRSLPIW